MIGKIISDEANRCLKLEEKTDSKLHLFVQMLIEEIKIAIRNGKITVSTDENDLAKVLSSLILRVRT